MDLADILQSATGKRWILRSNTPIEFSPLHDVRPFSREMISVEPFPPHIGVREAVATLGKMMEPMMWAGAIHAQLLQGGVDRALVDVTGNPLTGPLLFALRILQSGGQSLLFVHEVRGEVQSEERASIVDSLARLSTRDSVDRGIAPVDAGEDRERPPLAALLQALGDRPITKRIESALNEPEIVNQYALLSMSIAEILRAPAFVEALTPEAFADVVRALEGVVQVFIRTGSETAAIFAASLLARGVLLHAALTESALQRALELSALLVDRAGNAFPARREEALLSNLVARAVIAVKNVDEDYGDLAEMAKILSADEPMAYRVITRLVNDETFLKGLREQRYSGVRLARCDIALALLQRMNAAPGALVRDIKPVKPGRRRPKDYDQGSVLLELYRSLPPEFQLKDDKASDDNTDDSTQALLPTLAATANLAVWELERYYGIDLEVTRAAVRKYLEDFGRPNPPTLLFLRGFRSSKRLWIENAFTFDRKDVIPFPKEPPRLSIEAALTKGLAVAFEPLALGGLPDPLGMSRVLSVLTTDAWQQAFAAAAGDAAIIVVLPDDSDALTWELMQLVERRYLQRVVLLMAPLGLDRKAAATWDRTATLARARKWKLPNYDERGAFVVFSNAGTAREQHPFAALLDGSLAVRFGQLFSAAASA
jgi:hypothetical protein